MPFRTTTTCLRPRSSDASGGVPPEAPEGLQNEGMQQTKPAFPWDCAGFAADPRCSADCQEATT
jgi:hypothetical protein